MSKVKLISVTPNYLELLKVACSKPYGNSVGLKGIQNIIASGHLSILEHCSASFDVECSVRVLGQLTRHRHLSFTVKSARGCAFDDMVLPDGLVADKVDAMANYYAAVGLDETLEDAAYLLPQGAVTSMVVTGNFRAWYEYLPKRLCARALPEHQEVAQGILKELQKAAPEVFEGNFMNCKNCIERSCSFK